MYKGHSITAIIPCLNEEQGIDEVLSRMPDYVDEVIVVDNGSTDRTADVARAPWREGDPRRSFAATAGPTREASRTLPAISS